MLLVYRRLYWPSTGHLSGGGRHRGRIPLSAAPNWERTSRSASDLASLTTGRWQLPSCRRQRESQGGSRMSKVAVSPDQGTPVTTAAPVIASRDIVAGLGGAHRELLATC